jgi:hypothetical protein
VFQLWSLERPRTNSTREHAMRHTAQIGLEIGDLLTVLSTNPSADAAP